MNSIILSLDKFDQDPIVVEVFSYFNLAFYCIFTTEILIKLLGLGFKIFFNDRYNILDFIVVLATSVDLAFSYTM